MSSEELSDSPAGYDEEEILGEMDAIIHEILTMPEEKLMTMPTDLQEYLCIFIEECFRRLSQKN